MEGRPYALTFGCRKVTSPPPAFSPAMALSGFLASLSSTRGRVYDKNCLSRCLPPQGRFRRRDNEVVEEIFNLSSQALRLKLKRVAAQVEAAQGTDRWARRFGLPSS
jgi:hypothetical protein